MNGKDGLLAGRDLLKRDLAVARLGDEVVAGRELLPAGFELERNLEGGLGVDRRGHRDQGEARSDHDREKGQSVSSLSPPHIVTSAG